VTADTDPIGRDPDDYDPVDPVDDATLALLLEVAGTPKPGNVDRRRDLGDLRFESFLGGAVGARRGLELAADREVPLGRAFELGVAGMADRAGTNTQFGCLLLLTPLLRATAEGDLSPAGVDRVTRETTVTDAVRSTGRSSTSMSRSPSRPTTPTTSTCAAGETRRRRSETGMRRFAT